MPFVRRSNSGNMLAAVGPFALERGLVRASSPVTRVRILNINSGKRVDALVQTPGGKVSYSGGFHLDGVPDSTALDRIRTGNTDIISVELSEIDGRH